MEIKKVEYKDAIEIKKLLVNSPSIVDTGRLLPEILEHIERAGCVAAKVVEGDKILGVWLSKEFDDYISLSYFYIDETIRRKKIVFDFFMGCGKSLPKGKSVLICTKDLTGFDKYVVPLDGAEDTYVFKGLR